ncbi:hypothetical protein WH47_01101 [Habropoda laboriosa]|uniref:Uncharacterized protein n=1 Tax=Habropoda laboriosa TaxID=597456 RepID=A0A0L7R0Z7_9HYME|nr:hypothetical protein WH47_01101 [Habropoda laboriosa]
MSPHPVHFKNNRILIEYKQSSGRQQEKVAHGNMEEALCIPFIQSSRAVPRASLQLATYSFIFCLYSSLVAYYFVHFAITLPLWDSTLYT